MNDSAGDAPGHDPYTEAVNAGRLRKRIAAVTSRAPNRFRSSAPTARSCCGGAAASIAARRRRTAVQATADAGDRRPTPEDDRPAGMDIEQGARCWTRRREQGRHMVA